jgi:DNA-binding NarL/FixJ family response regulator
MPDAGQHKRSSTSAGGSERVLLADFCRVWSRRQNGTEKPEPDQSPQSGESIPKLAPRLRQVLDLLLAGDAEKQIAGKLGLSPHTIHDYVKMVYRRFNVCSRGELLAKWVRK